MRELLAGILIFLSSLAAFGQTWDGLKDQVAANIVVGTLQHRTPTVAVGVGINGQLVFASGFGNIAPGVPAGPNTVYHIGSVTKQFTAALILQLIEQGWIIPFSGQPLQLSSPVQDFFTGTNHWQGVTVGHLMTMRSGIPNLTDGHPVYSQLNLSPISSAAWPSLLAAYKQFQPVGTNAFAYSNTNYFLLGQIAEVVTQQTGSLHDLMRQNLFGPIGMTSTGFIGDYPPGADIAFAQSGMLYGKPDWPKGAGDIASTVGDLHRWNNAFLSGQIISQSHADLAMSAIVPIPPKPGAPSSPQLFYGMGWMRMQANGGEMIWHSGNVPGYTAFNGVARLNNGSVVTVILLTNADNVQGLDSVFNALVILAMQ